MKTDSKKRDELRKFNALVRWLNRITSPEGCTAVDARKLREYNHGLADEIEFYKRRVEMLGREQKRMRDPERTLVCDIIANGQLLPDPNGKRYGTPNKKITFDSAKPAKAGD